jgi:A/G-specific adenine glycosylase
MTTPEVSSRLLQWFDRHGRHDLPWQHPREPYRVWLAEIMLQQTQVSTVIPFFERFVARFPDVRALAQAHADNVLALWAGLGYYARARNLHQCAQLIVARHHGEFPRDMANLIELPGIGRSTAGAILAQAFGLRHAILDGNVRRVLARHAAIAGWPGEPAVQKRLWTVSERLLPQERLADYTQAIMDLGATVCTSRKPACGICPLHEDCIAKQQGKVLDYPASKPRRAHPQKRAWMLIIENVAGEIFCERRPPVGIWGGLWCLPMLQDEQDWQQICLQRYGLRCGAPAPLPALRHSFTHFDLEILPLRLRAQADADTGIREDNGRIWIKMQSGEPPAIGLPAPVRKLLESPNLSLDQLQCPEPSAA